MQSKVTPVGTNFFVSVVLTLNDLVTYDIIIGTNIAQISVELR